MSRLMFNFGKIDVPLKNLLYAVLLIAVLGLGLSFKKGKPGPTNTVYHTTVLRQLDPKEFKRYHDKLEEHFSKNLFNRGFNGGLIVAKDGVVLLEKYSGFADLRTHDSITANTSLHLASVSKTLTSAGVLLLMETGKLSLQDTLDKFFPGFPYQGITIKMLLSQRSGLPNYLNYLSKLKKNDTCYSNNDVLNSLYTLNPNLEYTPGTRFSYSNTNYVLLALIIEKVSGESYPAYMKTNLFDPLKMQHTFVHTANDSLVASPSFEWNGRYWQPDPFDCTYGDKNIYSTPQDMLKWDQALYNGQLFKKETLDLAFAPYSNERPSIHNYGLGWRMLNLHNGKKIIYHNGRWHGTNSVFVRLMDEKATIIIIGNKFNRNIYLSARKAYDIFGEYLQDKPTQSDETENEEGGNIVIQKKISPAQKTDRPVQTKR